MAARDITYLATNALLVVVDIKCISVSTTGQVSIAIDFTE